MTRRDALQAIADIKSALAGIEMAIRRGDQRHLDHQRTGTVSPICPTCGGDGQGDGEDAALLAAITRLIEE